MKESYLKAKQVLDKNGPKVTRILPFSLMRSEKGDWYSIVRKDASYHWRKNMNRENLKKSIASMIVAALILTTAGPMVQSACAVEAIGARIAIAPVSGIQAAGGAVSPLEREGLVNALANPGLLNPSLAQPLPAAGLTPSSNIESTLEAMSVEAPVTGAAAAAKIAAGYANNPSFKVIQNGDSKDAARQIALNQAYDRSALGAYEAVSVAGRTNAEVSLLQAASPRFARVASVTRLGNAAASAGESGVILDGLRRLWNIFLGWFGLGVKAVEMANPDALAEKYLNELAAGMPERNKAVADISAQAEGLRQIVAKQTAESAEKDKMVNTALNHGLEQQAGAILAQKKILDQSLAASQEQLASTERVLAKAKQARDEFYYKKEAEIAKVKALLAQAKQADMEKKMAQLMGTFKVGDNHDTLDTLEKIVDQKKADAKGMTDSAESSAEHTVDQIKKAAQDDEIAAELAARKEALAKKKAEAEKLSKQGDGTNKGSSSIEDIPLISKTVEVPLGKDGSSIKTTQSLPFQYWLSEKLKAGANAAVARGIDEFTAAAKTPKNDEAQILKSIDSAQLRLLTTIEIAGGIDVYEVSIKSAAYGDKKLTVEVSGKSLKTVVVKSEATTLAEKLSKQGDGGASNGASSVGATNKRDLTLKEFGVLNGVGIAASILVGISLHSFLIGFLGTYVAAIPLVFAYVGIKRLLGDNVNVPKISFNPGISWAGQRQELFPKTKAKDISKKGDDGVNTGSSIVPSKDPVYDKLRTRVDRLIKLEEILGKVSFPLAITTLLLLSAHVQSLGLISGGLMFAAAIGRPIALKLSSWTLGKILKHQSEAYEKSKAERLSKQGDGTNAGASGVILDGLRRLWNVFLGWFGLGVKAVEMANPDALAEKYLNELAAGMPERNKAVADISAQAEGLRQIVAKQTLESAEKDKMVNTALNHGLDQQAGAILAQKKILDQSLAASQEQLASTERVLAKAKQARDEFYYKKEAEIAKVKALLAQAKQADMEKKMAQLMGTFQVGDNHDTLDTLEKIVDQKKADAKGMTDSAESSAEHTVDQIKKAAQDDEIAAELAARKEALAKKKAEAEKLSKQGDGTNTGSSSLKNNNKGSDPTVKQRRMGRVLAFVGAGLPIMGAQIAGVIYGRHHPAVFFGTLATLGLTSAIVLGRDFWKASENQPLRSRLISTAANGFIMFGYGALFGASFLARWSELHFGARIANWLRELGQRSPSPTIKEVKKRHQEDLLKIAGVNGVGVVNDSIVVYFSSQQAYEAAQQTHVLHDFIEGYFVTYEVL